MIQTCWGSKPKLKSFLGNKHDVGIEMKPLAMVDIVAGAVAEAEAVAVIGIVGEIGTIVRGIGILQGS